MKTAICANYKPTDTLSARGFMAGLTPDYGLVSNGIYIYIEMITKLLPVDARGILILCTTFKVRVRIQTDS